MSKETTKLGFSIVSYEYTKPGPAGPFRGRNFKIEGKKKRGDIIYAPFGEARVKTSRFYKSMN